MKIKRIIAPLSIVLIAFLFFVVFPNFQSNAGSLTAVYLVPTRIETDLDGATEDDEVEFYLGLATSQDIPSGGTVTLIFPDADDGNWCRTAGTLTVSAETETFADLSSTDWDIDSGLPTTGTLAASCTQGSGASSSDTITISNVDALTSGTTYGVKVSNGSTAGVLGTDDTAGLHEITVEAKQGTTVDSTTFKISLISDDTVAVTATVASAPSVDCTLSTGGSGLTLDLGTLYPGGSYATNSHTISTTTSSTADGYYWCAYGEGDGSTDAGLYKSTTATYLIASTGSTTIDLTGVNAEGFGITVSDPDGAGDATVPADFSDASAGTFGALDRTAANAQIILYQNSAQTSPEEATVTYGARASSSAQAGSYSETVTFICGGYF
jgi:hypothetical protein